VASSALFSMSRRMPPCGCARTRCALRLWPAIRLRKAPTRLRERECEGLAQALTSRCTLQTGDCDAGSLPANGCGFAHAPALAAPAHGSSAAELRHDDPGAGLRHEPDADAAAGVRAAGNLPPLLSPCSVALLAGRFDDTSSLSGVRRRPPPTRPSLKSGKAWTMGRTLVPPQRVGTRFREARPLRRLGPTCRASESFSRCLRTTRA